MNSYASASSHHNSRRCSTSLRRNAVRPIWCREARAVRGRSNTVSHAADGSRKWTTFECVKKPCCWPSDLMIGAEWKISWIHYPLIADDVTTVLCSNWRSGPSATARQRRHLIWVTNYVATCSRPHQLSLSVQRKMMHDCVVSLFWDSLEKLDAWPARPETWDLRLVYAVPNWRSPAAQPRYDAADLAQALVGGDTDASAVRHRAEWKARRG